MTAEAANVHLEAVTLSFGLAYMSQIFRGLVSVYEDMVMYSLLTLTLCCWAFF